MAELKFKILGDLKNLKRDIKDLMNQKLDFGVKSSGTSAGGASNGGGAGSGGPDLSEIQMKTDPTMKKNTGKLVKSVGVAAGMLGVVAGLLKSFQPGIDLIKILMNIIVLAALKLGKLLANFVSNLPALWDKFKTWLGELRERVVNKLIQFKDTILNWLIGAWEFVKSLPGRIWEFLKAIPITLIEWLKVGWSILTKVWDTLKEKLQALKEMLMAKLKELAEKAVKKLIELRDKFLAFLAMKFQNFKQTITDLKDSIKEKLTEVKTFIGDKVQKVVSSVGKVKDAIWRLISKIKDMFPFSRGNDFVVTDSGKVIKTNPKDTIFATKKPGDLMGGSSVDLSGLSRRLESMMSTIAPANTGQGTIINNTININADGMDDLVDKLRRELGKQITFSGRF